MIEVIVMNSTLLVSWTDIVRVLDQHSQQVSNDGVNISQEGSDISSDGETEGYPCIVQAPPTIIVKATDARGAAFGYS